MRIFFDGLPIRIPVIVPTRLDSNSVITGSKPRVLMETFSEESTTILSVFRPSCLNCNIPNGDRIAIERMNRPHGNYLEMPPSIARCDTRRAQQRPGEVPLRQTIDSQPGSPSCPIRCSSTRETATSGSSTDVHHDFSACPLIVPSPVMVIFSAFLAESGEE